jgi:hypothetical protein
VRNEIAALAAWTALVGAVIAFLAVIVGCISLIVGVYRAGGPVVTALFGLAVFVVGFGVWYAATPEEER